MNHPFNLDLSDLESIELDFEEEITNEEVAKIRGGGGRATTLALGEEGGFTFPKPPEVTTQALSKEGGDPMYTTLALGEEGGSEASR